MGDGGWSSSDKASLPWVAAPTLTPALSLRGRRGRETMTDAFADLRATGKMPALPDERCAYARPVLDGPPSPFSRCTSTAAVSRPRNIPHGTLRGRGSVIRLQATESNRLARPYGSARPSADVSGTPVVVPLSSAARRSEGNFKRYVARSGIETNGAERRVPRPRTRPLIGHDSAYPLRRVVSRADRETHKRISPTPVSWAGNRKGVRLIRRGLGDRWRAVPACVLADSHLTLNPSPRRARAALHSSTGVGGGE